MWLPADSFPITNVTGEECLIAWSRARLAEERKDWRETWGRGNMLNENCCSKSMDECCACAGACTRCHSKYEAVDVGQELERQKNSGETRFRSLVLTTSSQFALVRLQLLISSLSCQTGIPGVETLCQNKVRYFATSHTLRMSWASRFWVRVRSHWPLRPLR